MLCILSVLNGYGQDSLIKEATYHFTIRDNRVSGEGADTLKARIAQSQFFLIGEEHDMVELQRLTALLMPDLRADGYQFFATEIGPVSAKKLTSIRQHKQSLWEFNSRYAKYFGGGPFGFFDGKEEELFLNAAVNNGIALWGIDFENYNAPLFLLDELYNSSDKNRSTEQAYNNAYRFVINEYAKAKVNSKYPVCSHMLNSTVINAFFNLMPKTDHNKEIISQLRKSWKIYEDESLNNWYPRVANMKTNFINYYKRATKKQALPKVFIKLGAVHTARGTSSSGFQEVGNTVYELANYNRTKCFSAISFARYRADTDGKITDEMEPEDGALLKYTTRDTWSLIDLKKLEAEGWQGKIKLSNAMKDYIQKYNIMLIPPITKRMLPNYKN